MSALRILSAGSDVSERTLRLVVDCVEDWFPHDGSGLNEDDFIDRLCDDYLNAEGWDIESLDTPAARKVMRYARKIRKGMA